MPEWIVENGMPFVWLAVSIVALIMEGATLSLVSIWFVPGALAAMILSFFSDIIWLQILVFVVFTAAFMVLSKTVWDDFFKKRTNFKANADAVIGAHGIVEEEINNLMGTGSVKVNGLTWTARSMDNDVVILPETVVEICDISGVKLICIPEKTADAAETFQK